MECQTRQGRASVQASFDYYKRKRRSAGWQAPLTPKHSDTRFEVRSLRPAGIPAEGGAVLRADSESVGASKTPSTRRENNILRCCRSNSGFSFASQKITEYPCSLASC